MNLNEAQTRFVHIDPQLRAADWKLNDRCPVLRQNAIRAENGAILFCHGGDKKPALDQEFLSGPRRFLLGGNVGAPAAYIL